MTPVADFGKKIETGGPLEAFLINMRHCFFQSVSSLFPVAVLCALRVRPRREETHGSRPFEVALVTLIRPTFKYTTLYIYNLELRIEFDLSKTQEGYNMARECVRMQKHLSAEGRGGIVFFYYTPEQEATVANNYTRMKEEQRQKRANDKAAGKPTHTARRKERVARE